MKEAGPMQESHIQKVGERMADARKALGLALEDIAESTRIPLRHLQAIEASNYDALPASTYSVGFVKTYARLVGLDPDVIGAEFREERGEVQSARIDYTPFEPADPSRVPPRLLATIALFTAVLIAAIYLVWRGSSAEETQQLAAGTAGTETAAPPGTAPKPLSTSRPARPAAPSATDKVELTATDTVWIKVREKDGDTLFMGELAPGQTYAVPVEARDPRLLTGRPYALRVAVGARIFPALSPSERTVNDVSLKGPQLAAFAEAAAAAEAQKEQAGNMVTTATP